MSQPPASRRGATTLDVRQTRMQAQLCAEAERGLPEACQLLPPPPHLRPAGTPPCRSRVCTAVARREPTRSLRSAMDGGSRSIIGVATFHGHHLHLRAAWSGAKLPAAAAEAVSIIASPLAPPCHSRARVSSVRQRGEVCIAEPAPAAGVAPCCCCCVAPNPTPRAPMQHRHHEIEIGYNACCTLLPPPAPAG